VPPFEVTETSALAIASGPDGRPDALCATDYEGTVGWPLSIFCPLVSRWFFVRRFLILREDVATIQAAAAKRLG
jgi:hypothetical protein